MFGIIATYEKNLATLQKQKSENTWLLSSHENEDWPSSTKTTSTKTTLFFDGINVSSTI